MLTLDLQFFGLAIPAVLFAAVSKAGFGSGASFVAAAILALIVEPGVALGVMLPLLLLIDFASLRPYWGKWHRPSVTGVLTGTVPGVALGAWLFLVVDAGVFRILIGAVCLAFVAYQFARAAGLLNIPVIPFSAPLAWMTGAAAAFTSFVSHAGGPVLAVFLLSQGLGKTTYQATTVIVFWIVNIMKFAAYGFIGVFTWETLLAGLILAPVALLGTWLGVKAHYWIPERAFFALTYVILVVTGMRLIWVGVG